jgi:hypothetical protein
VTLVTAVTRFSHVHFDGVPEVGRLSAGQVASFYLWHFLDLMQLNDLPGTLRWSEPLTYKGTDVGRLVVAFQLMTVVEIIATFRAYWTFRAEPREPPKKPKRKGRSKVAATTGPDRDQPDTSTTSSQTGPDPRDLRDTT